jgi:glycine cleavage system H protein
MSFDVPEDRRYLDTHEWVTTGDDIATIGISEFAQDELGDVVYVELPSVGDAIAAGERFGTIESIKAVSDLYAPVSGTVTAVNSALSDEPELLNQDPFETGWILRAELADASELEETHPPAEYRRITG